MKRFMAATAIGLAFGSGTGSADAATLGPQRTGETETYRLTSTETSSMKLQRNIAAAPLAPKTYCSRSNCPRSISSARNVMGCCFCVFTNGC